jgi:hypothetical protein
MPSSSTNCWRRSVFGFEAQQRCGTEPSPLQTSQSHRDHEHLAIDGKPLRATSTQAHQVHLLGCYDVTTGTVLWPCEVQENQQEIRALHPLLTPSLVKGRMLTLDAMPTEAGGVRSGTSFGEGPLRSGPGTTTPRSLRRVPICLSITSRIGVGGHKRRRGTKRMDDWSIDRSPGAPIWNDWCGKQWQGSEHVVQLERTTYRLKTEEIPHQIV